MGGLARLPAMATDGRLDALCERHGVAVLTAFGSAERMDTAWMRRLDLDQLAG